MSFTPSLLWCLALLSLLLEDVTAQVSPFVGQTPPPLITSVTGCPLNSDNVTLICSPPYTLTITGSSLAPLTSLVNLSHTLCQPSLSFPSGLTSSFTCVFGNSYTPSFARPNSLVPVSVTDLSTGLSSNTLYPLQLQSIPPIVLTSISGCTGGGLSTNNCDLSSSIITITGSGFQADSLPWYLIYSTGSTWYTDQPGFVRPVAYPITGGPTVVFALNYTLYQQVSPVIGPNQARSGNMSVCFSHGNTLSNCLALSWTWVQGNATRPTAAFISGVVTNPSAVITSVSGCPINTNGTTSGCVPPFSLVIQGQNLLSLPLPQNLALISVGGTRCIGPFGNATRITCYVPGEFSATPLGVSLDVVVLDAATQTQSLPYTGVEFAPPIPIVLTSISGCSGDTQPSPSLTTAGCSFVPSLNLTFTGSGFSQGATEPTSWQLVWSGQSSSSLNFLSIAAAYILNDTTVQIPLSALSTLLSTGTTPNITNTLCLALGKQLSDSCATVTVAAPVPVVSGVRGCNTQVTGANVSDCSSGVSVLTLVGSSFYSVVTVTVGGEVCSLVQSFPTLLLCTLPYMQALQPNFLYDATVTNFAGSSTLPTAVAFNSHPTIQSVTSQYCPNINYPGRVGGPTLFCPPNATLTIVGSFFSELPTLSVQLSSTLDPSRVNSVVLTCNDLAFDASTVLTCTLPQPTSGFQSVYGVWMYVTVVENATYSSNSLSVAVYAGQADAHINSIQGCQLPVASTRGVAGCQAGSVITLVGSNFALTETTQVQLFSQGELFVCASLRLLSSSQMTCVLPYVVGVATDSVLPIRWSSGTSRRSSNWLLAVDYDLPQATTQSTPSDMKFLVTISVLLPLVVLLIAAVAVLFWRLGGLSGKGVERPSSWARHQDESDVQLSITSSVGSN